MHLAAEAATQRSKSTDAPKSIVKFARWLVEFFLENRAETELTLTGEAPLVLLRDYPESLAERGRTAPNAAKHALTVCAEAIGIDWPLSNGWIAAAATADSNDAPEKAPEMSIETVRALGRFAANKGIPHLETGICGRNLSDGIRHVALFRRATHPVVWAKC